MKKFTFPALVILIIASLSFSSCDKIKNAIASNNPISYDWTGIDVTVNVPAVADTNLHGAMGTGSFTYNFDSLISNVSSGIFSFSNIDTFVITSCTLTILNPDAGNNFQNFQLAEVAFSTNHNTNGVIVGEVDNNPDTYAASLSLPITNANIRSYLASGSNTVNYVIAGKLRTPTTKTLTVNVHMEYHIHMK